jgi:3'(2'), 5'-bisphosphate nucleotidase
VAGGNMWIWDHAGAQLIFTEIGGKITDLDGKPINFGAGRSLSKNRGMVAAKEDVHERILAKIRECLGEENKTT